MSLLPHNDKVYKELVAAYKSNHSILLVHGTGLGKSFIFLELACTQFNGKKVLFVVPKHTVEQGISGYKEYEEAGISLTFATYNTFADENKVEELFNEYDVFVFDEAHHLGSGLFGKNARKMFALVKGTDKKILGMTATNTREDKIDVSDYFDETVLGMSTFDAIREGLIPPFEYLVCRDDGAERAGYDRKEKDYRKVIDYYDSLPVLSETVDNNKKDRWLCFFGSINELEGYEETIRELFTDEYTFIKITTRHGNDISEITKHEKTVVLCVDKLLEGVHVPKTQGIILFRNVISLPVFQQILGRVVHVGEKEPPIVIDCTRTAVKMLGKLLKEDGKRGNGGGYSKTGSRPVLYCSLKNIEHFNLTKLLALAATREKGVWTEDELKTLEENYGKILNSELHKLIPTHSIDMIQYKASQLGLKSPLASNIGNTWSDEESEMLKKCLEKKMPFPEIAKKLGRNLSSVKNRAKRLGLKRDSAWKEDEIEFLRQNFEKMSNEELGKALGRSAAAVKSAAGKLGIKKNISKTDWNDAMVEVLKKNYQKMNRNEIAQLLGIDAKAVTSKAWSLGLAKKGA